VANPATAVLRATGDFAAVSFDTLRAAIKPRFEWREFIEQCWFVASVSILPTCLVAIPFGAIIALQTGALIRQLGAVSLNGGASVIAVVREAGPIVTALVIAGAAGSAICADLGARKIRDEIDAMEVLGVNPLERLVVPRVAAMMVVSTLLNGLVSVVGVMGGYFFSVIVEHGTPGPYFGSFTELAQLPDLIQAEAKALVFGLVAGLMASYKGLRAKGGPKGVGDAVNQSVVFTFMLLFALNFVATAVYNQIVPQKAL
jgi:phospholipid/cholesterol/gamma-HCH transport system permease protein